MPPARRARTGRLLVAGLVACLVMFVAGTIATVAGRLTNNSTAEPSPPAATPGAPVSVAIADELIAVTLSWEDTSHGEATFTVIGGPDGNEPATLATAAPGQTSVRINGLNPQFEYCFQVRALTATSDRICTDRFRE